MHAHKILNYNWEGTVTVMNAGSSLKMVAWQWENRTKILWSVHFQSVLAIEIGDEW